jgi:predicted alpha/beta hydrolase family esterase
MSIEKISFENARGVKLAANLELPNGRIGDLIAAAEYLKNNYRAPTVIVGHSLGGAASLLAASQIVEIKAVATIGAPAAPQHVARLLQNGIAEIKETGSARLISAADRLRSKNNLSKIWTSRIF